MSSTFSFGKKNIIETLSNGRKISYPLSRITNANTRLIRGIVSDAKVNTIQRFARAVPNVDRSIIFSFAPARSQIVFDQAQNRLLTKTTMRKQYGDNIPIPRNRVFNSSNVRRIAPFGKDNANASVRALITQKVRRLVNNTSDQNDVEEKFDLTQMTLTDIANEIAQQNINANKFISASYDGITYFAFTNRTISAIDDYNLNRSSLASQFSDAAAFFGSYQNRFITLFSPRVTRSRPTGAFFRYTNLTKFDFSRYGIYDNFIAKNYKQNCLFNALVNAGLPDTLKSKLKTMIREIHIPVIKIKDIADELKIKITLYTWRDDCNKSRSKTYGSTGNEYNIALYDDHYFVYDNYDITTFAIKNYDDVKDKPDSEYICGFNSKGYPKYNRKSKIDSLKLIKLLIENKGNGNLLSPITDVNELMKTRFYQNINNINDFTLEYEDNVKETRPSSSNNFDYYKVWFDFETYVDKQKENKHVPYLVCWTTEDDNGMTDIKSARGSNCAKTFINRLPSKEKIMLIAHNLGYDYRFLFPHIYQLKPITRGNNILCASGFVYVRGKKVEVCLHDSYALITSPLRDFGEMFGLEQGKEVMPYDAYDKMTTYRCRSMTVDEFKAKLNKLNKTDDEIKADEKTLEENLKKWDCIDSNGNVILMKYSEVYCKIDVHVLKSGYMKFREWMLELTNIDIDDKVSIASLAHEYLVREGCYDDVLSLSGMPQMFIQKCVVGGRTMTAQNEMWHVKGNANNDERKKINGKNIVNIKSSLSDFDAVSLYPSAMNEMPGFLRGKPKVIKVTDNIKEELKKYDGYFIEIVITRVGKHRTFPLLSYVNEDTGVRCFTNDMIGKTVFIDRFGLEDAIKYHDIDFNVIRGYYFDSGRNDKINTVIQHLFNARLEKKKQGNPSQIVYKLIMNASYGKSILKPIDTRIVTVPKKNIDKFCEYNYQNIKTWTDAGTCYIVKLFKPINKHYNNCQVGTEILSYSKRLMNRVMTLAEDKGYNIYYQDTDSMHIETDKIDMLANEFKKIYGKELIGKQMGQFHTDFDLGKCKNIIADESLFLGKKCYIDSLLGDDTVRGYHIRMKGISERALKWTACNKFDGNVMELYRHLFNGAEVDFDMTCGGLAANFEFTAGMEIKTRTNFSRNVKFTTGYDSPI